MSTGGGSIAPTTVFLPFTILYSTPNGAINNSDTNFLLVKGSINGLGSANYALQRFTYLQSPTVLQAVITNVATLYIEGPTQGIGAALTNKYALWCTGGTALARFDNSVLAAQIGGNRSVSAPAIGVNANAGTAATATLSADSTDVAGRITLVTGSGAWAAGVQCTVALALAGLSTTGVIPIVTPANNAAATAMNTRQVNAQATDIAHWTLTFGVADVAATTYIFNYFVAINQQ